MSIHNMFIYNIGCCITQINIVVMRCTLVLVVIIFCVVPYILHIKDKFVIRISVFINFYTLFDIVDIHTYTRNTMQHAKFVILINYMFISSKSIRFWNDNNCRSDKRMSLITVIKYAIFFLYFCRRKKIMPVSGINLRHVYV